MGTVIGEFDRICCTQYERCQPYSSSPDIPSHMYLECDM